MGFIAHESGTVSAAVKLFGLRYDQVADSPGRQTFLATV
jgi:hypothetical protein